MSEHTNCWCESNIARCSLPDCPRRPRYLAEQQKRREWEELIRKAQGAVDKDAARKLGW